MKNPAPFLDVSSFVSDEASPIATDRVTTAPQSSPFLSLYEFEEDDSSIDPLTEEYVAFLNELHDEEFDEALFGLASEATVLYESRFMYEQGDSRAIGSEASRFLDQHFSPLVSEAELMLGSLAMEFSRIDPHRLTDDEIGVIVDRYHSAMETSPSFEEFFGKIKNAVKKVGRKAVSLAKKGIGVAAKLGLGPLLNKLKALIKPLLKRVIQTAIGKLPAQLQPVAKKLAERLPFLTEIAEAHEHAYSAETCEVAQIQNEFNQHVASLLFASGEVEQELEIAQLLTEQHVSDIYPVADLDHARDRFVENLRGLREGEDPTPHIEEFVPAILPALRVGIRLAGRKRVVDFLAGLLGKLIQKFVGPQYAPALSQAIVDAGLRLIQLEMTADEESRAAASAVAATVEETLNRVAALPDYVLDDQELLEGFALEAFEQAAAANLPAVLPEETYRKRPELAEARKLRGVWVMMPRGRRKRYKKHSRKFPVRLTPHKVATLETFHGIPLEEFLEEELGIALGEEVEAFVHLYEAVPGTHLPDIARLEVDTPGLGSAHGHNQLHPLTRESATLLLGEPGLVRDIDPQHFLDPHTPMVGERFYYLEIPGRRPLTVPEPSGRARTRRPTQLRLILDFPKNEIRLYFFLSEIRAQEIAVKLRQHAHIGIVTARLQHYIERGLRGAITGTFGRLKMIHEAVTPDQWVGSLRRLPSVVPQILLSRLTQWVVKSVSDHLKEHGQELIEAAENTADGLTMIVTLANPPGFPQLRQALKGKAVSLASLKMSDGAPTAKIDVAPGYRYE